MRGMRLAGLGLALCLFAALAAETWMLVRLADQAARLERPGPDAPVAAATQLALAQQALYAAILEHRLGAPHLAVRQAYENFAQRLEQMRLAAEAAGMANLPGLARALHDGGALTEQIDRQLELLPGDALPAQAQELLQRGAVSLREPLAQLLAGVGAAQVLAEADRQQAVQQLRRRALAALGVLAVAALAIALASAALWRQMRRAALLQARLGARVQELRGEADSATRGRLDALAFVAAETNARIGGLTSALSRALDNAELDSRLREVLVQLRGQTDDLLVLATDLADLARLEAGELRLRPAAFRLADAMEQAGDLLRHRFRTEALSVAVEEPSGLPAWWIGDAARLRQLLHHLGAAAAEMRAHGTVRLRAARLSGGERLHPDMPDRLCLAAEIDAGPASLPREQPQDALGARSLSLTLVRTLSAAMGGQLVVRDGGEAGCALRVVLPLAPSDAPAPPRSGPAPVAAGPLDILVVDDVVPNRRLLGAVLERFGHRCEMATDGLDALRAVQRRRFDVVLMDIQMPNLDGVAATRMLRALPPPAGLVPVIAVTAAGEAEDRALYAAAGMDGFVQKPVATDDLLAAIEAVTGGRLPAAPAERELPAEVAVGPLMDTQSLSILRSTLASDELARLVAATEAETMAALRSAEAAVARGDAPGVAEAASALAQTCEGVGGLRVVAIAHAMQAAAGEGKAARAAAHLPALRRALGETLAALNRGPPGRAAVPPPAHPAYAGGEPQG